MVSRFFSLSYCSLIVFIVSVAFGPTLWMLVTKLLVALLLPLLVAYVQTKLEG